MAKVWWLSGVKASHLLRASKGTTTNKNARATLSSTGHVTCKNKDRWDLGQAAIRRASAIPPDGEEEAGHPTRSSGATPSPEAIKESAKFPLKKKKLLN